jgi:predicted signal transduction protein with EAL and GGDEF domain/DNA-binding response OmpR family regulator
MTGRRHGQVVLVVDADPRLRTQAVTALDNCLVYTAADPVQAARRLGELPIDIVLLGATVPGAERLMLRCLGHVTSPPVVVIVEAPDLAELGSVLRERALDLTVAPVDWPVLEARLPFLVRTHRTLSALRQHEQRLLTTQRVAMVGDWELDPATDRFRLSEAARMLLGLPTPADGAATRADLLTRIHPAHREAWAQRLALAIQDCVPYECEFRLVDGDEDGDDERWLLQHTVVTGVAGQGAGCVRGTLQDITARRTQDRKIRRLAYFDEVTGLPNRRQFKERLARAVSRAEHDGESLAVLFVDLDEFKRINDTLGHTFGDRLLREVADRISAVVRESDAITRNLPEPDLAADDDEEATGHVARLGGDEFVILLTGLTRDEDASSVAARIVNVLGSAILIDGHDMRVTPSIGVAVFPRDGTDVDTLLRCADTAMYHAKSRGRNRFEFFSRELGERALRRLTLEGRLRGALRSDEFSLVYQPQFDVASGRLVGLEALIRWESEGQQVTPDDFIPVAESSGLIIEIGEWVLAEVLRQLRAWRDEGVPAVRIAINTSVIQFNRGKFCEVVAYLTEPDSLLPWLELEITEHTLMSMSGGVLEQLSSLRERGLRVSVDDFGTGYSNLSNLRHLPLDALKVDRSFVAGLPGESGDRAIVGAIVSMGRQLGLEVVAEGVETAAQRDWLAGIRCDLVQGYLLGYPVPADRIRALLDESAGDGGAVPAGS